MYLSQHLPELLVIGRIPQRAQYTPQILIADAPVSVLVEIAECLLVLVDPLLLTQPRCRFCRRSHHGVEALTYYVM